MMISQPPPAIAAIREDKKPRPFWSVMIPAYNPRADYLAQALSSVLLQAPEPAQMQIEVVDDCSPKVDVQTMVKSIAGERVAYSKTARNLGLAGGWNTCIERSRGQWVHILHQDDYLLPGFYQLLEKTAACHPEVGLLATRSFFLDADGVISGVNARLKALENGGRTIDDFFYNTPFQCPGVVVKRSCYEMYGGFRLDLKFVLDCEMWARIVSSAGGLVIPETLACYRLDMDANENATARLCRTGEGLRDISQLNQLFARLYPNFDREAASKRVRDLAIYLADYYSKIGDSEAAKVNMQFWKQNAPLFLRLRKLGGKLARSLFRA